MMIAAASDAAQTAAGGRRRRQCRRNEGLLHASEAPLGVCVRACVREPGLPEGENELGEKTQTDFS